ncbi:MAG: S8 family serine peptidase [Thermoanaerobaculia bacterium]
MRRILLCTLILLALTLEPTAGACDPQCHSVCVQKQVTGQWLFHIPQQVISRDFLQPSAIMQPSSQLRAPSLIQQYINKLLPSEDWTVQALDIVSVNEGIVLVEVQRPEAPVAEEMLRKFKETLDPQPNTLYFAQQSDPCVCSSPDPDPWFCNQWGLAAINAPAAWSALKGKNLNSVAVAVLDSGLGPGPDASKEPELATIKLAGWDLVTGNEGKIPSDLTGHGTAVTGILAAVHNQKKMSGVAGIPELAGTKDRLQILAVRVLDKHNKATLADLYKGMEWAISKEAHIINLSLGGCAPAKDLKKLIHKHPEVLFVASAGGDGCPLEKLPMYPAAYMLSPNREQNVLSVSASQEYPPGLVDSSNCHASLSAPGTSIYTFDASFGCNILPGGSSFAAPLVSGAAALILSKCNPKGAPKELGKNLAKCILESRRSSAPDAPLNALAALQECCPSP